MVQQSAKTLAHGSPVSVKLIHEQLARAKHMSLAEVFQFELSLSVQCCRHREFPEGVRALLVDKDGQPSWTYPDVASVEPSFIDELLAPHGTPTRWQILNNAHHTLYSTLIRIKR